MSPYMIVVANSGFARIFQAESSKSELRETDILAHPESRMHDRDISSDLPGRNAGGDQISHHAYSDETDPHDHEVDEFASQLASYLEEHRNNHDYDSLLLVSAPSFLGKLRSHMTEETRKLVTVELHKNLVRESPEAIRSKLPNRFPS